MVLPQDLLFLTAYDLSNLSNGQEALSLVTTLSSFHQRNALPKSNFELTVRSY